MAQLAERSAIMVNGRAWVRSPEGALFFPLLFLFSFLFLIEFFFAALFIFILLAPSIHFNQFLTVFEFLESEITILVTVPGVQS